MQSTLKAYASGTIGAVAVLAAGWIAGSAAAPVAAASGAMPVAQQNELVRKYCAACHNDAKMTGGFSLDKFDAAHPDPSLAAMLVSKLKAKAMDAAGIPVPDSTTQDALLNALSAKTAGASEWTVNRTRDPRTQAPIVTASILRKAHSATSAEEADVYRLMLTCHAGTREAEMQLSWAPGDVPPTGGALSAAVDGKALFTYKVDKGLGAAILYATNKNDGEPKPAMPLPERTLTISSLFPGETVVFPFGGLTQTVREVFSTCFTGSNTGR